MKIAILSWGSLIESGIRRGLAVTGGWNTGGPMLPIEFSRVSLSGDKAGCLTLVIDEQNGANVPTQYAISSNTNLDVALANLRIVENIKPELKYTVGYVNILHDTERKFSRDNQPVSCNTIKEWARINQFDAVIWTSLRPNFEKVTTFSFSIEAAIQYVSHLPEPIMTKVFEYIRNAPREVITPLRRALDDSLVRVTGA